MSIRKRFDNLPKIILIKTIAIIFFVELVNHEIAMRILPITPLSEALMDAIALSILVLLPLWFWIVQPLKFSIIYKESEIKTYNNALENHVIITKTDINGKITYINKKFVQISGYTEEEILGKTHRLINSGHHPKEFFSVMWKDITSGKVWHGQVKNKAKDGSYYWLDTIVSPILDSNGDIKEFISIRRDITKDKEINKQKVFYETILNSMEQGFIIRNRNNEIEHLNTAACDILEINSEESRNKTSLSKKFMLLKEDETPLPFEEYPGIITLSTGVSNQKTVGIRGKNGRISWLQAYAVPFKKEPNSLPDSTLITFLDITEQIKKTKQFVDSELRLNEAQKIAQIGSWSINLLDKKNHFSAQMYEIFPVNRQKNKISYEECYSYIYYKDRAACDAALAKFLNEGTPQVVKFRIQHPDKLIWVETRCQTAINADGAICELFGTCQDITSRVELEESLNVERIKSTQSSKLAYLGEISASIAHEINNPLAIISGIGQLFPKLATQSPEKVASRINELNKAIERVAKIVRGLKRYSRISSSDYRSYHQLFAIIQEAMSLCTLKSSKYNVAITSEITSESHIFCDAIEIEQVLINLISNAIDGVKDNKDGFVKIHAFDQGADVVIQISNPGTIPNNIREKLFEPFFTTKPVGEGTGLGLSISKSIIADHRGTLTLLDSGEYETCFEIKLPKLTDIKAVTNES